MKILLALLMTVLLIVAARPAPAGGPVLQHRIVVEDGVVRLGDLFAGLEANADVAVTRAPAPGRRLVYDGVWLANLARTYGLPWQPAGPQEQVVIERASRVIGGEDIERLVRDALRHHETAAGGGEPTLAVELDNRASAFHVDAGAKGAPTITSLDVDGQAGRFLAVLALPSAGGAVESATVSGRFYRMIRLPVLIQRLTEGDVIGEADIDWIEVRDSSVNGQYLRTAEELIGKSPRRPLREGTPIRAADVRSPLVVAKGDLVTITYATPHMMLTAQGRAMDSGARGDAVRVMNTRSKLVLEAEVAGSGHVTVKGACCTIAAAAVK